MTEREKEVNVDSDPTDDRAPLLSFPPKNGSAKNAINDEGDAEGASGSRLIFCIYAQ